MATKRTTKRRKRLDLRRYRPGGDRSDYFSWPDDVSFVLTTPRARPGRRLFEVRRQRPAKKR